MANFNEELYRRIIYVSSDEVTKENYSIFENALEKLKAFLDKRTSLDDTSKAKYFADFLQNLSTQSIVQILVNAKDIALDSDIKEAQARSITIEGDYKTSLLPYEMRIKEAEALNTETQAKLSIERMPKELEKIDAEIEHLKKQNDKTSQEILNLKVEADKGTAQKDSILIENEYKPQGLQTDIALKEAEIRYKDAQKDLSEKELAIKEAELEIKKIQAKIAELEIPLKQVELEIRQTENEIRKIQADIEQSKLETEKVKLETMKKELEIRMQELEIKQAELQIQKQRLNLEKDKFKLEKQKAEVEMEVLKAEGQLKEQQAEAVGTSLSIQKEIDILRNEKDVMVARIHATGSARE